MMNGGLSTTLPSSAFFRSDGSERTTLQAIATSQDAQMKTCHKGPACEDAYYIHGLVALFENRADAITVFQRLYMAMPASRYEVAAVRWLHLLQDSASVSQQGMRVQLRQEVLSTLLTHLDRTTVRSGKQRDVRIADATGSRCSC